MEWINVIFIYLFFNLLISFVDNCAQVYSS